MKVNMWHDLQEIKRRIGNIQYRMWSKGINRGRKDMMYLKIARDKLVEAEGMVVDYEGVFNPIPTIELTMVSSVITAKPKILSKSYTHTP